MKRPRFEFMPPPGDSKLPAVLIADECPITRAMIHATIQDLASQIWEAEDGCDAVELCQKHKPDWVILDLAMQIIDGITAMRMIKFSDPATRAIIFTAHDCVAFREAAKLHGASAYILKSDVWKIRDVLDPSTVSDGPRSSLRFDSNSLDSAACQRRQSG